jgi:CHAT domain-containing protein
LERGVRELSAADAAFGSLFGVTAGSIQHLQQVLPEDTTLVEYFVARGEVLAFLIDKSGFRISRRLASIEHIRELRQGLDFQMQKFVLGEDYEANHRDQTLHNTRQYLERLYTDLVATWVGQIQTSKVLFVPHGELHGLPFHALFDGERYLCDRFTIFYAPSAEVFRLGCAKPPRPPASGLLIGHADQLAPNIEKEIERLSAGMPECDVLTGSDATRDGLFLKAPGARFVHISSHGLFREDDPMFSGFRLSDGLVTALDLYSQSWPSELVSLTGCSTGAVRVIGGDELMGLVRGFLHAGARSLLLSLWNVNDEATVELVVSFYAEWRRHGDKARAIQSAMQAVRAVYSHPFYWAPFVLIGQP